MSRRSISHTAVTRSFAVRAACVLTGAAALIAAGGSVTYADEPAQPDTAVPETTLPETTLPEATVPETGEFEGTVVAVGLPPVPGTFAPDAEVVAVGQPPVPSFTVPDAGPIVASNAEPVDAEPAPELPETGPASEATAIVAGAVADVGAALMIVSRRV